MEFRKDFVTNSSSSICICEICGRSEKGWDLCLSVAEMVQCENGHTLCEDEMFDVDKMILLKDVLVDKYNEDIQSDSNSMSIVDFLEKYDDEEARYYIPEICCPICQFVEYSQTDLSKYLLQKYKVDRDIVFAEVKKINKRRKKLYENEYITHVCREFSLNPTEIVAEWKNEFGTYANFKKYLNSK